MIKFFRHIRQKLISQNRLSKYLVYALGEIVLVMVGILLALQVNNWNEGRKLKKLEASYLKGILDDLKSDTSSINSVVIPDFIKRFETSHTFLDSVINLDLIINESDLSKLRAPSYLTKSGMAFHPKIGTYNSMISEGNSGLIEKRELFGSIQELYENWYGMNDQYANRRDREVDAIRTKYAFQFAYNSKLEMFQNKYFLADLKMSYDYKNSYIEFLSEGLRNQIISVINEIEKNLSND